jgi:pyruvate,water dikinase
VTLSGDEGSPLAPGRRLRGLGVVAGRARGTVRVLASPTEGARLRPGDVLVARALDPSWTPLLLGAGAAVLELGGMLSHGAVVAREYGVPMVVDVHGATRLLRDGDEVTVDGRTGAVWLHP